MILGDIRMVRNCLNLSDKFVMHDLTECNLMASIISAKLIKEFLWFAEYLSNVRLSVSTKKCL